VSGFSVYIYFCFLSALQKLSDLFRVPLDYIVNHKSKLPKDVIIEDKTANE
jgi:hypothetical protein